VEKTTRLGGQIDKRKMKNVLKKFLSVIVIAFCVCAFYTPVFAVSTDLVTGDIGDYGAWTTEHNREVLVDNLKTDITDFQSGNAREYINTGVPIEARLGIVFIRALTHITKVLDESLVRFVNIFLIASFIFWIMFEAYKLISDGKSKAMPTFEEILRKAFTLGIWLIILGIGLTDTFGAIMGPIVEFGSYISELILDSVASAGNFKLSDTCAAIHNYATANLTDTSVIDAKTAASIMCVPTRMSGFYYGAIAFGWRLIVAGIGTSAFTVILGVIFVGLFTYSAFKFAFVAFGVIADLFLVIILLPFTAIAETLNKTSYKGIAGDIYNGFLGIFKASNLSSQIKKFIDATIYFISLAIVVAIGGALLAWSVSLNDETHIVTILDGDVITLLLTGALIAYIASHTDEIAGSIGGGIDSALGGELKKDITNLYNGSKKRVLDFIKALKK
jgi:hypothetical protein